MSSGAQICTSVSNISMFSACRRDWISFLVFGFGLLSFAFLFRSLLVFATLVFALALKRLLVRHNAVSSSACLPLGCSYLFSGVIINFCN